MKHPLENYRVIASGSYISGIEDKLYINRYSELINIADAVERERDSDRLKITIISDVWGQGHIIYETVTSLFISEYNKLEKETRSNIDAFILTILEKPKQQLFIENTIAILQELQNAITTNSIESKHEPLKTILLDKVSSFAQSIEDIYLKGNSSIPKIQWLGKTNLLGTLIYDLWQGQDKGKNKPNTKPLIKAQKKDLEALLLNNFLDAKGQPLTQSTISDYLNTSKPETRAKPGIRVELNN
ncbi:MAG: hypothetical protein E6Q24_17515 [Chitinophagaceae bacterium]|nr:MAG: hypothetical protein E6Q24_17515 [Chitinophagaceae bacterium]